MFCHTTWFTCFPTLGTGYVFCHTWLGLHVFLRLALVTCFATDESPYTFSHAWHCEVTICFPTRDGHLAYMFSYAWYWLRVFQHMICFPFLALVTCMFFSLLGSEACAKHFPSFHLQYVLQPVTCFTKLDSSHFTFLAFSGLIHCANCCCSCDWLTTWEYMYFRVCFIKHLLSSG